MKDMKDMKDGAKSATPMPPIPIGHTSINGDSNHAPVMQTVPAPAIAPVEPSDWEPSITGTIPYDELTRYICDMIYHTIGNAEPPGDGAVFEIEAKLGEIHNIEEGRRIRLPVMTETVFDKTQFGPPTRFESSMNVVRISPQPPPLFKPFHHHLYRFIVTTLTT
jgi:mRNA capping enzyme, beta chain